MAFYLIDFENTKNIPQLPNLTELDTIVFFYSQNANSLSFDLHIELNRSPAKKEYFMAQCGGKNALDFQMSSYVGFLISKYPDEKIKLISNDNGFGYLLSFWQEKGFQNLELEKSETSNSQKQKPSQSHVETLQETLQKNSKNLKLNSEQCEEVVKIVNTYKTKQAINNNLMKLLRDSDRVGKITKVIKPFLKNKN